MGIESEFFRSLLDSFSDGIYFVDRDRTITYWNRGAERITGYTVDDAVGTHCYDELLVHVDGSGTRLCRGPCPLSRTIEDGEVREAEVFLQHKAGHRLPVLIKVAPLRDPGGAIIGAVEVFSDNSARMAALERARELERAAYVDPLTGLANRALLTISLGTRLDEFLRHGWTFGVLLFDIDNFKRVNDRWGHGVGDMVLRAVAATLRANARSFDLVGRWGGEEFLAVVPDTDAPGLASIAERLRALVGASAVRIGDHDDVAVTVSIGGAVVKSGDTIETLINRADALMYRSKWGGRNKVSIERQKASSS